ncbi:hypothetical protein AAG604_03765 [Citromicrobium bathyomarinum]|uniref:hypothetical protein n=1 Tax=Citromicrobium sp. WPS32 TaxID=1634517 RepID=UPI0006C91110|nr:hypothetical protein [Citromicrobium sp. WPS32]MAY77427.1 hypothetical protein [Citromicrobium sp.]|tara:strand:+ start:1285 stop:1548 length:264 start_codon:yes stop_codon:yes gene_type:complete
MAMQPQVTYRAEGDASISLVAKRMGMSTRKLRSHLPALHLRGFPTPDPTTGHFDLDEIERWRQARHSNHLSSTKPADLFQRIEEVVR